MLENTTINSFKLKLKLKNMAYKYLAKYSSSSANLQKHLLKKVKRFYIDEINNDDSFLPECQVLINEILAYLIKLGYLNDELYAKQQSKKMIKSGKSYLHTFYKLKEKGLDSADITTVLASKNKAELELFSALVYLKKKSFGAYHKVETNEKQRQKEIAAFNRNGFSFEIMKQALHYENSKEIDELIIQLKQKLDY